MHHNHHHHRPHSDRFGLGEDIFGMRAALPLVVAPPIITKVVPGVVNPPIVGITTPAIDYPATISLLQAEIGALLAELKAVNLKIFEVSTLSNQLTADKAALTSTNLELTAANAALVAANATLQNDLKTCSDELASTKALLAEATLNYQNGLVKISELEASNLLNTGTATAAYDELNTRLTAQITALQAELEASKLLAADTVAQMATAEAAHAAKIKELTTKKKSMAAPLALAAIGAYFAFNH